MGQSDCGVACHSSIIKFHGGKTSLERLRELSGTTTQGTTLLGLYQASSKLGFNVEGFEAESIYNLASIDNPAILHVKIKGQSNHYIVFYKLNNDGSMQVGDPAKGIVTLQKDEIEKIWITKALLLLTPNQDFKKSESSSKHCIGRK